jgi:hypothetical protein
MRATALKYAMSVGLCGMLALGTATGFGQLRAGTVAGLQVTQYCIPPRDNPDAHRFYCGNDDGWADPTGAAFRLLHAGGRGKSHAAGHRFASTMRQDCDGRGRSNALS